MHRISLQLLLAFLPLGLCAAPVTPDPLQEGRVWYLPGSREGALVSAEKMAEWKIQIPLLTEKETKAGGEWRGILSLDLHGGATDKGGSVHLEIADPETGEVLATANGAVAGKAPRAAEAIIASSEHGRSAKDAFDGDPKTSWHSNYAGKKAPAPHWVGLSYGSPQNLEGVTYQPRLGGFTNGVAREWKIEGRKEGGDWATLKEGTTTKEEGNARTPVEVKFESPIEVEAWRFVVVRDWSGGGFGTAGEVTPIGVERSGPEVPVSARRRMWVEISSEAMTNLTGKEMVVRVKSSDPMKDAVVSAPRLSRVNSKPSKKLFGRSNGGLGPDKLGAGLLGFDGLSEHRQDVLTVMAVRPDTPAAAAGLRQGDAIVAIDGKPLSINDLAPGLGWLSTSHEAFLGRAGEVAIAEQAGALNLALLRDGKIQAITLQLPRTAPIRHLDPATDPATEALVADLVSHLERAQREDGSWGGNLIRTTLASLALLSTGEEAHVARVGRAVEWSMKKYPEPAKYGNLGFWFAGYATILYSEWHLRTDDGRVLSHIEAARDWAMAGQHESKWEVPALGHGPSGLPYDKKSLVAPACHLLVGEALAKRCGVESQIWELLLPYMEMSWSDPAEGGHGSLGYNRSYKDKGEFWSRTGLFAMAAHLRGERPDMSDAMTGFMAGRHQWMRNSHAYGEPGGALGLLGLHLVDPEAFDKVLDEYRWWFSLAWEPGYGLRFTTPHMGAPYMGEDELVTAAYALVLQARKKNLHLTGKPE